MRLAEQVISFIDEISGFLEENSILRDLTCAPPEELHIELTYRCNSSCIMCNIPHLKSVQKFPDITLRDIAKTVENSKLLKNIRYFILSGGEPWYNRDFSAIAIYLLNKYPDSNLLILSNLLEPGRLIAGIKEIKERAGLKRVSLGSSLDGTSQVHDRIRGVPGAFNSAFASALTLEKRYPGLRPVYNCTVLPENADNLFDLYKWSERTGFNVVFQASVPKKELDNSRWTPDNLRRLESEYEKIIKHIWKVKNWQGFNPSALFENLSLFFFLINLNYILKYVSSSKRYYGNCPCGEKYAMINPDGELYFCPVYKDMTAGNIREKDFDMLWEGESAGSVRDFFNERKCHCWLSCTSSVMVADNFFKHKEELEKKFLEKLR